MLDLRLDLHFHLHTLIAHLGVGVDIHDRPAEPIANGFTAVFDRGVRLWPGRCEPTAVRSQSELSLSDTLPTVRSSGGFLSVSNASCRIRVLVPGRFSSALNQQVIGKLARNPRFCVASAVLLAGRAVEHPTDR